MHHNLVVYYLNQDINRLIEKYNTEEITAVFPKYYKEIKKFLLDSNEALLVEARTYQRYRNNHDERRKVQEGETEELENKYQKFSKIVEKQHIYREEILGIIPALEEYRRKSRKEHRVKAWKNRGIGAIISAILFFILRFIWYAWINPK